MKQIEKINIVLSSLYNHKYDNRFYSVHSIMIEEIDNEVTLAEANSLGMKMEDLGYIKYSGSKDSADGMIIADGVEYIEELKEKEKDNEVIKDQVQELWREIELDGNYNDDTFKRLLDSKLWYYDSDDLKLKFLNELEHLIATSADDHSKKCTSPGTCQQDKFYKHASFFVTQSQNSIEESADIYSFNYYPEDPFGDSELEQIQSKLDEVLIRLEKLELGQQIIFDGLIEEFEELKELASKIGKKNFKQLLIGKLVELGVEKTLSLDIIQSVTGELPRLPQ